MQNPHSPLDPALLQGVGHRLVDVLTRYLQSAQSGGLPVLPRREPADLAQEWNLPFQADPTPDVQEEFFRLVDAVLHNSNHLHHPGYIGHQIAVPLPLASCLEMVGSLLNNGMAVYEMGQLQTIMEKRVVELLREKVGFGSDSSGILTHGGSLGNLTALLAARQAQSETDAWNSGQDRPLSILVSASGHYSLARAVRIMGWGADGAWPVETTREGALDAKDLYRALSAAQASRRKVVGIVANCCSTATGVFDPLESIADFCEAHSLWLHVDGAHGASLAFSSKHRGKLKGIERAHSVVWDLHKMMGLPALSTAVLFRDKRHSYETFSQDASYLFEGERGETAHFNLGERTIECTKRGMGTTAYGMLTLLGTSWFGEHVDTLLERAQDLAALMDEAPDFELACPPEANIVCFRYFPVGDLSSEDLDQLQRELRQKVIETGEFYIVETELNGSHWLRATVMNPLTRTRDLRRLLQVVRACAYGR